MPLTDSAVLIPGTGHIYLAPVGTPAPTSPDTVPATPWVDVGHTSRDNGLTLSREGGDSNIKGSWQSPNLRDQREPTTWTVGFQMHQVDGDTLRIYFGGGVVTAGHYAAPAVPVPQDHALWVVMIDGTERVGLYWGRLSILAADDITVDVENLLTFPVKGTVLSRSGASPLDVYADSITAPPTPATVSAASRTPA